MSKNCDNIFKCFICFENFDNHKRKLLCPHCSKIGCRKCLKKWIVGENKKLCPHCRGYISCLDDFVDARFLDDVFKALEKDRKHKNKSLKNSNAQSKERNELCKDHNLEMNYYCKTCRKSICSDCAIFNHKNQDCRINRIEEVWNERVKSIKGEGKKMIGRLNELRQLMQKIEENIHDVSKNKEIKVLELSKIFHHLTSKLNSQMKSKMTILLAQKYSVLEEIELIKGVLFEVDKQINAKNKSQLISNSQKIIESLGRVSNGPKINEKEKNKKGKFKDYYVNSQFDGEFVPKFKEKQFIVSQFDEIIKNHSIHYTDPLKINGITWRLKLYSRKTKERRRERTYLSCFLEATSGISRPSKYEYKIEIVNFNDKRKNIIREFSSIFQTKECWGYNKFVSIEELKTEDFFSPEGSLILKIHIRPPSFFELSQELQNYVSQLEGERKEEKETGRQSPILYEKDNYISTFSIPKKENCQSLSQEAKNDEIQEEEEKEDDSFEVEEPSDNSSTEQSSIESLNDEEENSINSKPANTSNASILTFVSLSDSIVLEDIVVFDDEKKSPHKQNDNFGNHQEEKLLDIDLYLKQNEK